MFDFVQYTPTKIVFGNGGGERLEKVLREGGYNRVLLHYGGESAVKSGLITRTKWMLERLDIAFVELAGVKPNPRLSLVREGVKLCVENKIDLILAVGGGSVIDSAKAIGMGAYGGGDVWDYYSRKRTPEGSVPVGVILTIAAAGSEMSNSSVITNEGIGVKRGLNTDVCRPVFAILNPELTFSVPEYQTMCGCADMFLHSAERYLTGAPTLKLTDAIAEAVMTTVINCSKTIKRQPEDYDARANLMWASSLSHNGLTGCGGDGGDWSTHVLSQELSARFDCAHGAALTAIWGSWARYVYRNCLRRFHKFAVQVMGVRPNGTREELALKGIDAAVEWYELLGLPTSISGLGIKPTEEELREMAKQCAEICGGAKGSCMVLHEEDMYKILRDAV